METSSRQQRPLSDCPDASLQSLMRFWDMRPARTPALARPQDTISHAASRFSSARFDGQAFLENRSSALSSQPRPCFLWVGLDSQSSQGRTVGILNRLTASPSSSSQGTAPGQEIELPAQAGSGPRLQANSGLPDGGPEICVPRVGQEMAGLIYVSRVWPQGRD